MELYIFSQHSCPPPRAVGFSHERAVCADEDDEDGDDVCDDDDGGGYDCISVAD